MDQPTDFDHQLADQPLRRMEAWFLFNNLYQMFALLMMAVGKTQRSADREFWDRFQLAVTKGDELQAQMRDLIGEKRE